MIVLDNDNTPPMHLRGVGLIKISDLNAGGTTQVLFQKGIGIQLIHTILKLNKAKIITKKQGIGIGLISDYTVYMHYFNTNPSEIIVIIYLDNKESIMKFSSYYEVSKKLNEAVCSCEEFSNIQEICDEDFIIPRLDSVLALFIISTAGHLYYSKVNEKKCRLGDFEIQISGFISALLIFTKEMIGQGPGVELKHINFGNQQIYLTVKTNVIFAYFVEEERILKLDRKYMQLVSEEFLDMYKDHINPKTFNGDLSKYQSFGNIIDKYIMM
ncbi:MAG: hypothetical protein KGD74_09950 [Candidatus Lokiarchaeota archaeon]|nr:hypothetical protein [Candidatus Lokiarchaeota archaeon]